MLALVLCTAVIALSQHTMGEKNDGNSYEKSIKKRPLIVI
jgi:hypothetical protein